MSNAVFFNSYKLKKGASVTDFLHSVDDLINGYASKQKGAISFSLLVDGDTWADFGIFSTLEDAKNFENPSSTNDLAEKFYSFLNFNSCKSFMFSVERSKERVRAIPNVVTLVTFKLKNGASVPDFLNAKDKIHNQERGDDLLISQKLLVDKDLWADLIFWKSMEGPKTAVENEKWNAAIKEYQSFIGEVPFMRHFKIEKSY
jgi:hypothetical protein